VTVFGREINFPNLFKESRDLLSGMMATVTESMLTSNHFSPKVLQQQRQQQSTLDNLIYKSSFHQPNPPPSTVPGSFPNLMMSNPIVDHAQQFRDSSEWGLSVSRSSNHFPAFGRTEPKCNLFVAEMYADLGYVVPVNSEYHASLGRRIVSRIFSPLTEFSTEPRPYLAKDYYEGKVPGTEILGKGSEGLSRAQPGDIISDGRHMAIISGDGKSIHASAVGVVENNFGFRPENTDITVIRSNWPKK
jgi:cell wall-associated NlpC family hydrolase